jgi:hypothetical protein
MSEEQKSENKVSDSVHHFPHINAFKKYYSDHKDEIDNLGTNLLNQIYKIDNYLIRKLHGSLIFRKICDNTKCSSDKTLKARVERLEKSLNDLILQFNNFLDQIEDEE